MKKLSEDIRQVTERTLEPLEGIEKHLRETAKKWASYVLEYNTDEALKKGLEISRSIVDYLNELQD